MKRTRARSMRVACALLLFACGCDRHPPRRHEHDRAREARPPHDGAQQGGDDAEDDVAPPSRHLGEMMAEVGRRLERSGRSVAASRWELAAYDIEELEEVFEDEIAVFVSADDALDVGKVAAIFARTHLPKLEEAITRRDRAAFERAFAQTTEGCNGCHRAANHPYIEVPSTLGEPIPRLTPITDAGPANAP